MDIANQENGLVVGTMEDSSATCTWLGTYNGDHICQRIGVNAGVPKTLVLVL